MILLPGCGLCCCSLHFPKAPNRPPAAGTFVLRTLALTVSRGVAYWWFVAGLCSFSCYRCFLAPAEISSSLRFFCCCRQNSLRGGVRRRPSSPSAWRRFSSSTPPPVSCCCHVICCCFAVVFVVVVVAALGCVVVGSSFSCCWFWLVLGGRHWC